MEKKQFQSQPCRSPSAENSPCRWGWPQVMRIRNIPGLHPMLWEGVPSHPNLSHQSLIKRLIYTHNVREISKIDHKSRGFCCFSCDSHRGPSGWLIVQCLTTLIQPRAHPSSPVASTYDSVLSGLVSINLLLSAVGKDNPAGEREEGTGSPTQSSVTYENKTHCFVVMVPTAALLLKT